MSGYFKPRIPNKIVTAELAACAACCLLLQAANASPNQRAYERIPPARQHIPYTMPPGNPQSTSDGVATLRRMLEAESLLTYSGTQVTTVSRKGLDLSSQQYVTRDGANGLRIEYFQPAELDGEIIVDNGVSYWHYDPSTKTMEAGQSRLRRDLNHVRQQIAEAARGALQVSVVGQESVAGRECTVIEVHTGSGTREFRRFWVDSATGVQLKVEQYRPNGRLQSGSFFTQISFNPTIAPNTFTAPRTPAGVTTEHKNPSQSVGGIAEAQNQVGFVVRQPGYLPQGFGFQSAQVSHFRKNKMVVLQYNNGMNVLSLYETPAEPGRENPRVRSPRAGVVTKTQAGLRLLLVANLSIDEMTQVIELVR